MKTLQKTSKKTSSAKDVIGILIFIMIGYFYSGLNRWIASSDTIQDTIFIEKHIGEIKFSHPANWLLITTPHGNHGDLEFIAVLAIPFQSLPNVTIREYENNSENNNKAELNYIDKSETTQCKNLSFSYNKIYLFSFCSDANDWHIYEKVFDKIISSINNEK